MCTYIVYMYTGDIPMHNLRWPRTLSSPPWLSDRDPRADARSRPLFGRAEAVTGPKVWKGVGRYLQGFLGGARFRDREIQ